MSAPHAPHARALHGGSCQHALCADDGQICDQSAEWLSPYMHIATVSLRSARSLRSHSASLPPAPADMCSASVVDVATVYCNCDFQLSAPPAIMVTYALVERRESSSWASRRDSTCRWAAFLVRCSPAASHLRCRRRSASHAHACH
jgi:hypothetical protein